MHATGKTPDAKLRATFYEAVRSGGDAGMARSAARLLRSALQRFRGSGQVPEDLHWRLAAVLRQAGVLPAAVEVARVLYAQRGLQNETRLFLSSTMAAALLELAAANSPSASLDEVERALRIAWALDSGNDGFRAMWRTLDRLRGK